MTTLAPAPSSESVRFADGSIIELRPLVLDDAAMISDFVNQLSPESGYKRFLSYDGGVRGRWVANLINADQRDTLVHGAVAGNDFGWSLVAIAESIRDPGDAQRAEYALAAIDPWQNMGIGTLLTRHVARIAVSRGIRFWETYILLNNARMARVMDGVGQAVDREVDLGVVTTVHKLNL